MSTSYQIVSDLHIEYLNKVDPFELVSPSADVLIMAGDIGSLYKYDQLFNFINTLSPFFKYILYTPGNHEYYVPRHYEGKKKTFAELQHVLDQLENSFNNLIVLNCKSVRIGDVCIAGATLWSKLKCPLPSFIVRVFGFTDKFYNDLHDNHLRYLEQMKQYCNDKKLKFVCITHHPPSYKFINPTCNKHKYISLYASDLDYFIDDSIHTWIFGHVHYNYDTIYKKCRMLTNQLGRIKDKVTDYDNSKIFVI